MATPGGGSGFQQQQQQQQNSNPSLQHQQSFPSGGTPASSQPQPQMTSPMKSVNTLSLCKLGQETNQELVTKLLELFKLFKTTQLPNSTNNPLYQDKRLKIEESLRQLSITFRKLRVIYQKVSEMIVDPDDNLEQVLVPLKGNPVEEKNTDTDVFKFVTEEHKQIIEQIQQKNRQIKEVIDKIRTIIWEINTMIVMRKT